MANAADPLEHLTALKPEEVDFLAAVARRAFQSVLEHKNPIDLKTDEGMRKEEPKRDLYTASFSFQLPNPKHHLKERPGPGRGSQRWSPKPYKVVEFPSDGEPLPSIVEDFLSERERLGASPHFVLLNELCHSFEAQSRLRSRWIHLAETYKTYIVPGTFHCRDEFFGVAPIYCPDRERSYYALKQNVAVTMQEQIRTPDERELIVIQTDYGNIVLWICLDMYDPGLVLKFLNMTHRFTGQKDQRGKPKREISLVLVPSYSSDSQDNIRNCVTSISRFSKTAMVCTNAYLEKDGRHRLESHGFSCGEPLDVVAEKAYELPGVDGVFCQAILYRVDLEKLREYQAANFQRGIFSSAFSAIINGDRYDLRNLGD